MKSRILQAYHVTHTAKELAAELGVGETYVRQIAMQLRKEGHDIPRRNLKNVGQEGIYYTYGYQRRFVKTADGWQYVKKQ